jgi:hypothetical protein
MKNLIAFLLACFAFALGVVILMELAVLSMSGSTYTSKMTIKVISHQDVTKVVEDIKKLNLPNTTVIGQQTVSPAQSSFRSLFPYSFSVFFIAGLVMVIYKRICRWMGISPTI